MCTNVSRRRLGYGALGATLIGDSELAQTAADPKLRSEAAALLAATVARLREVGQDISRWNTEQPGDKPS